MFNPDPKLVERVLNDQKMRREITQKSFKWFFYIYFYHYITYGIAPFHEEIFNFIENESIRNLVLVAFRGSAKSTIISLAYVIWAILGRQQKKFVLIAAMTQQQARLLLNSIKIEFENNTPLRADLGPFREEEDEWRSYSLVLPQYSARITAVSSEQSVRGVRNQQYRPDLIIGDDLEDISSAKTQEGRDKTYLWLKGELMPCGDLGTRSIFVGNLLHEDSLMMRLRKDIEEGAAEGVFRMYPLIDANGNCAWLGKYPDKAAIEKEEKRVGNKISWLREYLLLIVADEDQLVRREWIQYADSFPEVTENFKRNGIFSGVDLAISTKESADFTSIVAVHSFGIEKERRLYVEPYPVNKRLNFPDTLLQIKAKYEQMKDFDCSSYLTIEDVGYQRACIESLEQEGIRVEAFTVDSQDKRARLASISHLVQQGIIIFPRKGAEYLIEQLCGFGYEKHDDLVDAFVMAIITAQKLRSSGCSVVWLNSETQWPKPVFAGIRKMRF